MNKLFNILSISFLSISGLLLAGCDKMDDTYEQFKGEEITYTAKADSIKIRGGNNRIQLSWLLISDPKVRRYKVYWNNRKDSVENSVVKTKTVDTVRVMLDNMPEQTYNFEIFMYDKDGNSSVKATANGKVYGQLYKNSLLNRAFRDITRKGNDIELKWMDADEQLAYNEIKYTDAAGALKNVKVAKTDDKSTLSNFPIAGTFSSRSAFLPEPNALDTFYTAYAPYTLPSHLVQWNDFDMITGHSDYLLAKEPASGILWRFSLDADGMPPKSVSGGWNVFDVIVSSTGTSVVGYKPAGTLHWYPLGADGVLGTSKQIATGWQIYNMILSHGSTLLARKTNGELWRFPLSSTGVLGTGTLVSTSWAQYNAAVSIGTNVFARKPDGTLFRIPVGSTGSAGTAVQVATGWNQFDLITQMGSDILARKPNGELWKYPVNASGALLTPSKITKVVEDI